MNQNATILAWLRKERSITPMQALTNCGVYRLGARIFDLRDKGHLIQNTEPLGKPARYVLMKEAGDANA